MSHTFQVLRCSECSTFQVHQVKKSNKWCCKMCGGKQSTIRHYGTGTGRDCRLHVQKLNSLRGDLELSIIQDPLNHEYLLESNTNKENPSSIQTDSKWSKFMEKIAKDVVAEPEVSDSLHGVEAVLEIPKEKKRKCSGLEAKPFSKKAVGYIPKTRGKFEDTPTEENKFIHTNQYSSAKTLIDFENDCGNIEYNAKVTNMSGMPNQIDTQIQNKQELQLCSKYEPVKVSKHSKWAQFVENETCDEDNLHPEDTTSHTQNLSQIIFTQCSDDDLDTLLDI